jgi:carboxypeptidase Q
LRKESPPFPADKYLHNSAMKKNLLLPLFLFPLALSAQTSSDSAAIRKLFNEALSNGRSYQMLDHLCNKIGARPSGSEGAQKAVEYTRQMMEKMGADKVYLQEVMVPHWERGEKESAKLLLKGQKEQPVPICALGGSVPTDKAGLTAEVVEVQNFDELKKLGREKVQGKIVFFNRPMDPNRIFTFHAYGGAVDQRGKGAIEAARLGAAGVLVRSMTLSKDDYPHTGAMRYADSLTRIPAAAISTNGADLLSSELKKNPDLRFFMKMSCRTLEDAKSYNVIGEIRGSELPDEIIAVGGHLDSWDLGTGAHDDGAGCVQSLEVLRLFRATGIKPRRTIRVVMFMNEEFGLRGGKKYAELALENKEKHTAAIESDAGGFSPRGFSMGMSKEKYDRILSWKPLLEPYGLSEYSMGGGGADLTPLEPQKVPVMELVPDSQRYFDFHHAATDTFDKINKRELELGSASLAAMVYLISQLGL